MSYDALTSADELDPDVFEQWRDVQSWQMRIDDTQATDEYVMVAFPGLGAVYATDASILGSGTQNWRGAARVSPNDFLVGSFTPEFRVVAQALTINNPGGVSIDFNLRDIASISNGDVTPGAVFETTTIPGLTADDMLTAVNTGGPFALTTGFYLITATASATFAAGSIAIVAAKLQVRAQ